MTYLPQGPAKGSYYILWKQGFIVLLAFLLLPLTKGYAQEERNDSLDFSLSHPLIYEDAWDLWPYAFLDNGEPTGYNVDLVKMICEELDIPYIIKLKDNQLALNDLKEGRADLTMGMRAPFHDHYGEYGKAVLQLFTHSYAHVKGTPQPILQLDDLADNSVIVHDGSLSHHIMQERGWGKNAIPYQDMKEAVLKISTDKEGIILWNTMSLKWLINQYQTDNLELLPSDMPHGEYVFMSNNTQLLALMDSTYNLLRAQDRLTSLENKWFYPERKETGIPSWIWTIANVMVVIFVGSIVFLWYYKVQERRLTRKNRRDNTRLALTLKASGIKIWTYDVKRQTVTWLDINGNTKHEDTLLQFFHGYSPHDFEQMMQALNTITSQQADNLEIMVKAPSDTDSNVICDYAIAISVLHRDADGKPAVIIGTRNDISQDRQRQRRVRETLTRYQAIFDSIMVDMLYFDKSGKLVDLNDKACETFHFQRENIQEKGIDMCTLYGLKSEELSINRKESFYATIPLDIPNTDGGKKHIWYELKLQALYNLDDQLQGFYGTGREVTETSINYHLRQEALLQMNQANKKARLYMDNINYALKAGGMRFAKYQPATHTFTIYRKMEEIQNRLTQTRAMNLLTETSRILALRTLNSMDSYADIPIDVTLKTKLKLHGGENLFVQFLLVPSYHNNTVKEYVGVCRDVSAQKNTEEALEIETQKAQEVETVKNSFLHNMNYEIRTPLNSIVGFAEFFQMPHAIEDEPIFVNEIKENSSKLLKLINNILFLSRIDARMIEIKTQPTDFALTFDSMCNTSWGSVKAPKDKLRFIVENRYSRMILDIDNQNIGHILDQIIANAIHFTKEGTICARYDYTGDRLLVAVEDTGCGIEQRHLDHIFDRFSTGASKGTGLGLSICYELVKLMGGNINIKSEKGKGTTVWFTIPCKALDIERKDI